MHHTMAREEGEILYELTKLGLSMDATKELREQEKAIEEVHKMLDDKKKKAREEERLSRSNKQN